MSGRAGAVVLARLVGSGSADCMGHRREDRRTLDGVFGALMIAPGGPPSIARFHSMSATDC
jgi:hypothetical protein